MVRPLDEARQHVRRAFEVARDRKGAGWQEMRIGVLKNRLLDQTRREFSEEAYGAGSMWEFVNLLPDVLEVVTPTGTTGTVVRWRDASLLTPTAQPRSDPSASPQSGSPSRIRPDLWNAVLDYESGSPWYWDTERDLAVQAVPSLGPQLQMPTVTRDDMARWRSDFAQSIVERLTPEELSRVEDWARRGLTTDGLPARWRGRWNQRLKQEVSQRLDVWFADHQLRPPHYVEPSGRSTSDQLRALMKTWVDSLTDDELRSVTFPVSAILRGLDSGA